MEAVKKVENIKNMFRAFLLLLFSGAIFFSLSSIASAEQCVRVNNNLTASTVEWYSLRAPNHFTFTINSIERTVTPHVDDGSQPVQTTNVPKGTNPIVCNHTAWEVRAVVVRFNGFASLTKIFRNTINIGIDTACGSCGTLLSLLKPLIDSDLSGFVQGLPATFKSGVQDNDIAFVGIPDQFRALTITGDPVQGYFAGIDNVPVLKGKGLQDPPSPMYHVASGNADLAQYKTIKNSYHPGVAAYQLENTSVQGCAALCSNNVLKLVGLPGKCVAFNYTFTPVGRTKPFTCSLFSDRGECPVRHAEGRCHARPGRQLLRGPLKLHAEAGNLQPDRRRIG